MVAPWRPRRAVVLALVVLAAAARRSEALELFVRPARATHGAVAAPAADGSNDRPFTSLTQARDAVRRWRRAGSSSAAAGNATVHLVPGLYTAREGVPLTLTAEDGGAPDAWTPWKAWDPADPPRLSAGVAVPSHLFRPSAHDSRVLVADLTGLCGGAAVGALTAATAEVVVTGSPLRMELEMLHWSLQMRVVKRSLQGSRCGWRLISAAYAPPFVSLVADAAAAFSATGSRLRGIKQRPQQLPPRFFLPAVPQAPHRQHLPRCRQWRHQNQHQYPQKRC